MSWQDDPIVKSAADWRSDPVVPDNTSPYQKTAQSDTNLQNLGASVGGAMYAPYLGIKQMLGKATPEDVAQWKQAMSGLWSTPMGKVGTIAGGAVTAAPLALIPGAATLPGAALGGLAYGGAQPVTGGDSRLANAVEGMGGGVAGYGIGKGLGALASKLFADRTAQLAAQKAAGTVRDATGAEAQAAGYAIPPTQMNPEAPGMLNRALEGLSGKIQTGQLAGIKNQKVTNALAKQALGLSQDTPLTADTFNAIRSTAGEAYRQLKSFGPIQADSEFGAAMKNVAGEYLSLAQNMPSQKIAAVDSLLADLNQPTFSSSDAVELVKRLRFDGFRNVKAPDPNTAALGRIQIGAQNAVEDLIDRNLQQAGQTDFLSVFRNARAMIAKSYTVENAVEESTGKVVASQIAKEFAKGRPLTGELATIGKVAQAFPKAVQNVNTSMPGLSPLDYAGGALGSLATGSPAGMLAPLARPLARSMILSKPYQAAMVQPPSYEMGLLGRYAPGMANSEITQRLLQSLGISIPSVK